MNKERKKERNKCVLLLSQANITVNFVVVWGGGVVVFCCWWVFFYEMNIIFNHFSLCKIYIKCFILNIF